MGGLDMIEYHRLFSWISIWCVQSG